MTIPTEADARRIASQVFHEPVISCTRFPTGLRHWVYDVVLQSGTNVVVRLSHPDNANELAGGVFWHEQLASAGVAVATVLDHDVHAAQPYMILERLAGSDLGNVFDDLTSVALDGIAESVATLQRLTSELPIATGFGYALDYNTLLRDSWRAVLEGSIDRSEAMIHAAGVVNPSWVQRVREQLDASAVVPDVIAPTAFLHDATTKNVIVANGELSGIVDVDEMAFGDPLWSAALTKMSLLSAKRPTDYADRLAELTATDDTWKSRMELYCTIFCLGFLAELGQRFNQAEAVPIDRDHQLHLEAIMRTLLTD